MDKMEDSGIVNTMEELSNSLTQELVIIQEGEEGEAGEVQIKEEGNVSNEGGMEDMEIEEDGFNRGQERSGRGRLLAAINRGLREQEEN